MRSEPVRGEQDLSRASGEDEQGCSGSAPPAVARGEPKAESGSDKGCEGQGRSSPALAKGLSSLFRGEETVLKRLHDLPHPTSDGAGIQTEIRSDSTSQSILNIIVPKNKELGFTQLFMLHNSSSVLDHEGCVYPRSPCIFCKNCSVIRASSRILII